MSSLHNLFDTEIWAQLFLGPMNMRGNRVFFTSTGASGTVTLSQIIGERSTTAQIVLFCMPSMMPEDLWKNLGPLSTQTLICSWNYSFFTFYNCVPWASALGWCRNGIVNGSKFLYCFRIDAPFFLFERFRPNFDVHRIIGSVCTFQEVWNLS